MRALSLALRSRMAGDSALTALLGVTAGSPSIVTKRPVPDTVARPLVLAADTVADVDEDLLSTEVRRVTRDVGVHGQLRRDEEAVEAAATRIVALFHRRPLEVSGFRVIDVRASGPITAPAEDAETARLVTLTVRLQRI